MLTFKKRSIKPTLVEKLIHIGHQRGFNCLYPVECICGELFALPLQLSENTPPISTLGEDCTTPAFQA